MSIDATPTDFYYYGGGVYDNAACTYYDLDHSVLAVGFGVSEAGQKCVPGPQQNELGREQTNEQTQFNFSSSLPTENGRRIRTGGGIPTAPNTACNVCAH